MPTATRTSERSAPVAPATPAAPNINVWISRFWQSLVRRRIAISIIVVTVLIIEDILLGERPHAISNLRDAWTDIGLALVVLGVFFRSWAAGVLRKNAALATNGPYAMTRNPLYLGSLLMTLGFCTLVGDWDNGAVMLGLALVVYWPKIRNEESYLAQTFPSAWPEYVRRTPRLFPRRIAFRQAFADWRFAQWLANREYNALTGAFVGLIALQIWFEFSYWTT